MYGFFVDPGITIGIAVVQLQPEFQVVGLHRIILPADSGEGLKQRTADALRGAMQDAGLLDYLAARGTRVVYEDTRHAIGHRPRNRHHQRTQFVVAGLRDLCAQMGCSVSTLNLYQKCDGSGQKLRARKRRDRKAEAETAAMAYLTEAGRTDLLTRHDGRIHDMADALCMALWVKHHE